jgi:ribosomal protein S18 acetylase RimI-like enzyme
LAAELREAATASEIGDARRLFRELAAWYADEHGLDVGFQGFAAEVRDLPGKYAPPGGALILAYGDDGAPAGCVAVRRFNEAVGEIKRLYVRPQARGSGLGRRLAEASLAAARRLGYRRAVLDTASFMEPAQRLYEALGFRDIPPYYENPYAGAADSGFSVRFLGRDL